MTEAGKMCEMHGMEACPKEEKTAADEQPMYNGKDKTGKRQLILDKNKLEERHMNAADRAREEILKRKYDESEMKSEMIKQYGPKEGQKIYFAYIRKHAMKKGKTSIEKMEYVKRREVLEHIQYKIENSKEYIDQYVKEFYPKYLRVFNQMYNLYMFTRKSFIWDIAFKLAIFGLRRISYKINFEGYDPYAFRTRDIPTITKMIF